MEDVGMEDGEMEDGKDGEGITGAANVKKENKEDGRQGRGYNN